jgi:hypothetical protein
MDDLVVQEQDFPIVPVAAIKSRVQAIRELVESVMQENVHYGKIPGTPKKSLWKPGAELICAMLRIGVRYEVEDLARGDVAHYRVRCIGFNTAGQMLGEGLAEASTGEEKYRWRTALCQEEYDDTPETHRRIKYRRGQGGGHYKQMQIKTETADSANTILKMAAKRAHVAMTLTVAGCSDFFSQDFEDIDGPIVGDDEPQPPRQPQRRSDAPAEREPPSTATTMKGERAFIERKLKETGKELGALLAQAGMGSLEDLNEENFKVLKGLLG